MNIGSARARIVCTLIMVPGKKLKMTLTPLNLLFFNLLGRLIFSEGHYLQSLKVVLQNNEYWWF